jgi:AcrR family transcriptional regulator
MVRQPRSEVTRRKIINAAVELFNEVGYASAGLGDIIERVDVTKGALYHHFDSKEALAFAVIEEAMYRLGGTLRQSTASASALESLIQAGFAGAELTTTDKLVRTGMHLLFMFARYNESVAGYYRGWLSGTIEQARKAQVEGDIRPELDPEVVGDVIVNSLVGADVVANSVAGGTDTLVRVIRIWEIILPTMVPEASLPYFRQFVSRVSSRHLAPAPSGD